MLTILPSSADDARPFEVEHPSPSVSIERPVLITRQRHSTENSTLDLPSLILFFSWTGAQQKHIAKYTSTYHRIYPDTSIIVIGTSINDVVCRTSKQRQRALLPTINILTSHITNSSKILVHAFCEGATTAVHLAKVFLATTGYRLPLSALILDSCPGTLTSRGLASAGRAAVPGKPAAQVSSIFLVSYPSYHSTSLSFGISVYGPN